MYKDYDLVHAIILNKIDQVTMREIHSMLLTHEKRLEKHNACNIDNLLPFANLASNQAKKLSNKVSSEINFNKNNHQYAGGK